MRPQGTCPCFPLFIRNIKFAGSVFNDLGDLWIMYVTDGWKQMVFNLEVQSTDKPGKNGVSRSKIHGGSHLVLSPVIFKISASRKREFRFFHHVCGLKDHS